MLFLNPHHTHTHTVLEDPRPAGGGLTSMSSMLYVPAGAFTCDVDCPSSDVSNVMMRITAASFSV